MKKKLLLTSVLFPLLLFSATLSYGQGIPEILYYKFNDTGTSIRNYASSPPKGTSAATIYGGIKQGTTAATCGGTGLLGTGTVSTSDYVDTKWKDSLIGTSWTISFWTKNLDSSTALYYIFSDPTAGNFRCFMGGASGAGNIFLRGPFTDVLLTGGSGKLPKVSTFVYDASAGNIYAYINGKLINTVAQSSITINSTGTFLLSCLGGSTTYGGLNNGGIMDEFRFYNRALSASEVSKLLYYGNTTANLNITACGVSSYKSPSGKYTWTSPGTYRDTMLNKGYCDSFMTINLAFSKNTTSVINAKTCDFYVAPSKKIYTKSGVYTDIIKNKGGCDSIITLNLTMLYSTTATLNRNACQSYTSPSKKYTWTVSGTYNDTIPNKVGCDSVMTIRLTMHYTGYRTLILKECDRYVSPSKKKIWTVNGVYKDTIPTNYGCDSVITINLTIIKRTSNVLNEKHCELYKSPSGKHVWTQSGTYADSLINKAGCDSVLTIHLIINKHTSNIIVADACERYTSPSGKYTWTLSGAYNDTLPNKSGCDSLLTIDLRLHGKSTSIKFKSVCIRSVSPSGKYTWTKSGKYYDTIPNRWGCDSVMTINLTVNEVEIGVTKNEPMLTAVAFGADYQWLDCNKNFSAIAGETHQAFTAKVVGNYAVRVTENGCTDTSLCYTISKVGIARPDLKNRITAYPNPTDAMIQIFAALPLQNATVKLISANGVLISETGSVNGKTHVLDMSAFPTGIYFIEVREAQRTARIKVAKF